MWEQYVEKAQFEMAEMGDRALELRCEDLVQRPQDVIPQIAQFCGVADKTVSDLSLVEASRAFAFSSDSKLTSFAQMTRDVLHRHGYAP